MSDATHGMVKKPWPAQLNKLVWERRNKKKSVVFSIGQVVPHEVLGMANFNKNLFVGAGGLEAINLSHFIGAVYGMEKMMGRYAALSSVEFACCERQIHAHLLFPS